MLVEDNLRMCAEYLIVDSRDKLVNHRAQTYHIWVLRGKLRTLVQLIQERETGGVLQRGERRTQTLERLMEVLRAKHLEAPCTNSVQPLPYPPSDGVGCGDMSGLLQDHRLEDDEPLQVPLSVLHPAQLSP